MVNRRLPREKVTAEVPLCVKRSDASTVILNGTTHPRKWVNGSPPWIFLYLWIQSTARIGGE